MRLPVDECDGLERRRGDHAQRDAARNRTIAQHPAKHVDQLRRRQLCVVQRVGGSAREWRCVRRDQDREQDQRPVGQGERDSPCGSACQWRVTDGARYLRSRQRRTRPQAGFASDTQESLERCGAGATKRRLLHGLRWSSRSVKCRPLPLLSCIPFAVALSAGLVGCGRIRNDPGAAGAPSGGRGGSSGAGGVVLPGGSAGDAEGGAVSEATYAGAVLAMLTEHDGTESYVARAVFAAGPRPTIGGCPQCCCSSTDRGLPLPDKPPDASRITLLPTAGGAALATLVPELFEDGHGAVHGMIDLGWSWFAALSDYAAAPSQAWK